jgi:putative spermidine/putrescine transport system permease protein
MLSTLLSLLIGLIITRILYRYFLQNKWKVLVWIPMLLPHFVAGYIVVLFFAQSGWISSLFYQLGLISDRAQFPILVIDAYGIGIILTYIWKEVPFVILMLLPVYYQLDQNYEQVVRTLGGRRWQVFRDAEWPWLFPVVRLSQKIRLRMMEGR